MGLHFVNGVMVCCTAFDFRTVLDERPVAIVVVTVLGGVVVDVAHARVGIGVCARN